MDTVDLADLSLELLVIAALHEEAERLASELPEQPPQDRTGWRGAIRQA